MPGEQDPSGIGVPRTSPRGARRHKDVTEEGRTQRPRTPLAVIRGRRFRPRRLSQIVLAAVVVGYGSLAVVGTLFQSSDAAAAALGSACAVAVVVLQLGVISRQGERPPPGAAVGLFAAEALLVLLPILLLGPISLGLPGFLAGSALILFRARIGGPLFVLVVVALVAFGLRLTEFTGDSSTALVVIYLTTSATTSGIAVFGLTSLVRLTTQADERRAAAQAGAVWQERLRFTSDLESRLGRALAEVGLTGSRTVRRLHDRADAHDEVRALLARAREAQTDVRTVSSTYRSCSDETAAGTVGTVDAVAPRLARSLLAIVLLDFVAVAAAAVAEDRGALTGLGAASAGVGLLLVLHRLVSRGGSRTEANVLLVVGALLALAPLPWFGSQWHAMSALIAAAGLVRLPRIYALPLSGVLYAGALTLDYLDPPPNGTLSFTMFYLAVGFPLATMIVAGTSTVANLAQRIEESRDELTRLAVERERIRLARDVHDLLGFGLSAVVMKIELAERLLESDRAAAAQHLLDALDAARSALTELGSVAADRSYLHIDEELARVAAALGAAGIATDIVRRGAALDQAASEVLAVVLRESTTNILRHSGASRCRIVLTAAQCDGWARLTVINDGLDAEGPTPRGNERRIGTGTGNMLDRVTALDGHLTTHARTRFYALRAEVRAT